MMIPNVVIVLMYNERFSADNNTTQVSVRLQWKNMDKLSHRQ